MAGLDSLAWFKKYEPKTLEDYVFETEEQESQISNWIKEGSIPGNIILYGPAGTGKSALSKILINSIVKSKYDLQKVADKSVAVIDELRNWCPKQPISSKQKIIYIEELDRASSQAFNSLKDGLMENYQPHVAFVCTTNFINKIEHAVQTRFNFKFNLECMNKAKIYRRLETILNAENIPFEVNDLAAFIVKNRASGLRTMLNLLQTNVKDGKINFNEIQGAQTLEEENIINLVISILDAIRKEQNFSIRTSMVTLPRQTPINQLYTNLLEKIKFNNEINYDTIYEGLFEKIQYMPYLTIIDKYLRTSDNRKHAFIHFMSFYYELTCAAAELHI